MISEWGYSIEQEIRTEKGKIGYIKSKKVANEITVREEMEEEKALKLEIKKRKEEKRLLKSQKRSLKEKKIWILLD